MAALTSGLHASHCAYRNSLAKHAPNPRGSLQPVRATGRRRDCDIAHARATGAPPKQSALSLIPVCVRFQKFRVSSSARPEASDGTPLDRQPKSSHCPVEFDSRPECSPSQREWVRWVHSRYGGAPATATVRLFLLALAMPQRFPLASAKEQARKQSAVELAPEFDRAISSRQKGFAGPRHTKQFQEAKRAEVGEAEKPSRFSAFREPSCGRAHQNSASDLGARELQILGQSCPLWESDRNESETPISRSAAWSCSRVRVR